MALGDVLRTCEAGGCCERAAFIGAFEDRLKQRQTRGACGQEHLLQLEREIKQEGFEVTWRLFPVRPTITEIGGDHGPTQA